MATTIIVGSCVFAGLCVVSTYLIMNHVTKDEENPKLKSEYRKYHNILIF